MVVLFESNATTFTTMGLGALQPISCKVTEEEDGEFSLEMEYPVDGPMYSQLTLGRILATQTNPTSSVQPFRIYQVSAEIKGKVTISALHIAYDLTKACVTPFKSTTLQECVTNISTKVLGGTSFTFSTTKTTYADATKDENTLDITKPTNVKSLLFDDISKKYTGGKWAFDGYSCIYYNDGTDSTDTGATRGSNKGVVLYYGKNFNTLQQDLNNERVVSAIYPYWGHSSTQNSVGSVLLKGIKSYLADDSSMPLSKIVESTGLDRTKVWQKIVEFKENNTVDLSEFVGQVVGDLSTQSVQDTYTADGSTRVFTLGHDYVKITKVTDNSSKVAAASYTYDKETRHLTFNTAPLNGHKIVVSGNIPDIVTLANKLYAPTTPTYDNVVPVDLSSKFSTAPSDDDLRREAKKYWEENQLGTPKITINIGYRDLHRVSEFMNRPELYDISIGDTIGVVFTELGINTDAEVTAITYDAIRDEITGLSLGNPKASLASVITTIGEEASAPVSANEVQQSIYKQIKEQVTVYALGDSDTEPPFVAEPDPDNCIWSEVVPEVTTGKYLWAKHITRYYDGSAEADDPVCIDYGTSDLYERIQNDEYAAYDDYHPIYYLKTGINKNTAPASPLNWVTSTSTYSNQWTTVIPSPASDAVYYSAGQSIDGAGNITNTIVIRDDFNTRMIDWMSTSDSTKIDGGQIYSRSITSLQLDTQSIKSIGYTGPVAGDHFSQSGSFFDLDSGNITTPAFAVSGEDAYFKGAIDAESGTIGSFVIDDNGIACINSYNPSVTTVLKDGVFKVTSGNSMFRVEDESATGILTTLIEMFETEPSGGSDEPLLGCRLKMETPAMRPEGPSYTNGGGALEGYWTLSRNTKIDGDSKTLSEKFEDMSSKFDWRPVKVNGVEKISRSKEIAGDVNYLDISDGSGVNVAWDATNQKIKINHSNSVTALTQYGLRVIKYDANGHITDTRSAMSSDLPAHSHSEYATYITYNSNNRSLGLWNDPEDETPISSTNLPTATESIDGLLTKTDKTKINNLPEKMITYEEVQ